jgi:hypothetical protein
LASLKIPLKWALMYIFFHHTGMHRIKMYHLRRKVHFVVMTSVFDTPAQINTIYDLKGSLVGRSATAKERASGGVLKDNDLIADKCKLHFGSKKAEFMAQLEKDAFFLAKLNIMDYSLLVGIHDRRLRFRDTSLAAAAAAAAANAAAQASGDAAQAAAFTTGSVTGDASVADSGAGAPGAGGAGTAEDGASPNPAVGASASGEGDADQSTAHVLVPVHVGHSNTPFRRGSTNPADIELQQQLLQLQQQQHQQHQQHHHHGHHGAHPHPHPHHSSSSVFSAPGIECSSVGGASVASAAAAVGSMSPPSTGSPVPGEPFAPGSPSGLRKKKSAHAATSASAAANGHATGSAADHGPEGIRVSLEGEEESEMETDNGGCDEEEEEEEGDGDGDGEEGDEDESEESEFEDIDEGDSDLEDGGTAGAAAAAHKSANELLASSVSREPETLDGKGATGMEGNKLADLLSKEAIDELVHESRTPSTANTTAAAKTADTDPGAGAGAAAYTFGSGNARRHPWTSRKDEGINSRVNGKRGDEVYYLGVIDILQQYNANKRMETVFKVGFSFYFLCLYWCVS